MVTELTYGSSQEAWEGINEYFLLCEEDIVKRGGTRTTGLLVAYDLLVNIGRLWVNPEFDFGRMFNYRKQKWTTLVGNYVDINYLDIVKSEVLSREKKKDNLYNVAYIFDNSHQHGKGCLISITFCRRPTMVEPLVIVNLRSSEIVKRLNFDFLLVQRISEYVYGPQPTSAKFFFPNAYTAAATSAMYNTHKPLKRLFKPLLKADSMAVFQAKVYEEFLKYSTIDKAIINYKVNLRVARALQDKDIPPLLAKNLTLR